MKRVREFSHSSTVKASLTKSLASLIVVASLLGVGGHTAQATNMTNASQPVTQLSAASECVATPGSGHISGVISSAGSPHSGAIVRLANVNTGDVESCVIANSSGQYFINTSSRGNSYLLSVEPSTGANATLGASGSPIRIADTPLTKNFDLVAPKWSGTVTLDGVTAPAGTSVCLSTGSSLLRCSQVVLLENSSNFYISDSGLTQTPNYLVGIYNSDNGRIRNDLYLGDVRSTSAIEIAMESVHGGSGADSVGNGCSDGDTPNISGRVMNGNFGYQTIVGLGYNSWTDYSSTVDPSMFAFDYLTTSSTTDGSFSFCFESGSSIPSGVVQVEAVVADIGATPALGNTRSMWLNANCLTSSNGCVLPEFAMQPKSLWGQVTGDTDVNSNTATVPLANQNVNVFMSSDTEDEDGDGVYWERLVKTDAQGRYALSETPVLGRGTVSVSPHASCDAELACDFAADQYSRLTGKSVTFTPSNSAEVNVELQGANFVLQLTDKDGYEFPNYAYPDVQILKNNVECSLDDYGSEEWWDGDCEVWPTTRYYDTGSSRFVVSLPEGNYTIVTAVHGFGSGSASFSVDGQGAITSQSNQLTKDSSNVLTQQINDGNILIEALRKDDQSKVTGYYAQLAKINVSNNGSMIQREQVPLTPIVDSDGVLHLNVMKSGVYGLRLRPNSGPYGNSLGLVETDHAFQVNVANDGTATILSMCSAVTMSCTDSAPTGVNGRYQLQMDVANVTFKVCADEPSTGTECGNLSGVYLDAYLDGPNTNNDVQIDAATQTGTFRLTASSISRLRINYYDENEDPSVDAKLWVPIERYVRYSKTDSGETLEICGANSSTMTCNSPQTVTSTTVGGIKRFDLGLLRFSNGNVIGSIFIPNSTTKVLDARVQVETLGYQGQISYYGDAWTNRNGDFAFQLSEGTYRVTGYPGYEKETRNYTSVTKTFSVASNGTITSTEPSLVVDGKLKLVLTEPNLQGQVLAGDTPVRYSYVEVQKQENGNWMWRQGVSTDSTGTYRLNLGEGTWRLTSRPYEQFAATYAPGSVEVVMNSSGQIDSTKPGSALVNGKVNVSFASPNFRVNLSTEGIRSASLQIAKYNPSFGYFEYLSYSQIGSSTPASTLLANGRYRLEIYPWNNPEYVRTDKYIWVADNGICVVSDERDETCNEQLSGDPKELNVALQGPNVKGRVLGSGTGQPSWVQIERMHDVSGYFQHVQGVSTDNNGNYGLRLTPGFYKLTANPQNLTAGFTRSSRFIVVYEPDVDGDTWCNPSGADPAPCTSPISGADDPFNIDLKTANVRGSVSFNGQPIQDAWINVTRQTENGWNWVDATGYVSQGKFSVTLEGDAQPVQYQLTINPPYQNPNNLGRKKVIVWVGDFVPTNTATDDVCVQDVLGVNNSCAAPIASGTPFTVTMTTANFVGRIVDPLSNTSPLTGVMNSNIEVRKWDSANSYWQWTDQWANSGVNGAFSLNLDEGSYRIRAQAPYGITGNLLTNSREIFIYVTSNDTWCSSMSARITSCESLEPNLEIQLGVPNTIFTLQDGNSQPVPYAWVNVEKRDSTDSYWSWIDASGSSNQNGQVAFNLAEAGTYRLNINPPWNSTELARFTKDIQVGADGKLCVLPCTVSSAGTSINTSLTYPTPNLKITLKQSAAEGASSVPYAWVNVEKWESNGNYWSWINQYTNSNFTGQFSLLLSEEGQYRVSVNSPGGNFALPRFSRTVFVSAQGKICPTSAACDNNALVDTWAFPTANMSGVVKVTESPSELSKYSWVYVRNTTTNSYDWTNTDSNGAYRMYLEDGIYDVWFYPDYSKVSKPPILVRATVSDGALSAWRYDFDDLSVNKCSSSPCGVNVAFDYVPPNVRVKTEMQSEESSTLLAKAFVRFTDASNANTFYDFVTNSSGELEGRIPAGTYNVSAVHTTRSGSTVTLRTASESGVVVTDTNIAAGTYTRSLVLVTSS